MKLVLFDIDGTLLQCGRQVGIVFLEAMEEVFGPLGDVRGHSFAGKTDPRIILDIVRDLGFEEEEVLRKLPEVRDRYLPRLEERLCVSKMRLLPGVGPLLERLHRQDGVVLGLLTGNWEGGARVKLSRFDLNPYFEFGAFGDDGIGRSELPPVAMERARAAHDRDFDPADVLIVGDTVHDVTCGQDHGISVLGVATGHTPAGDLRRAGADWVVDSLEEVSEVPRLRAMLKG